MKTLTDLTENENFKQLLADSFGGIMYNVANHTKYNTPEILAL